MFLVEWKPALLAWEEQKMKRLFAFIVVLCMTVPLLPAAAEAAGDKVALPTSSSVYIDGQSIAFTAYNIDGSNYFKLRDLACALNETDKRFSVGWDESSRTITLTTGQAYSPIGGELTARAASASKTAVATSAKLFCNDVYLVYTAYNIDGSNYFKLRDILQIMCIGVTWDESLNSISVDTSAKYVYEKGIVQGTSLPELRVKGNWPMPERSLQTAWAKYYPVYATILGLPTKILAEGITWEWDDSITPDTVGFCAETNSFMLGPLPHHHNFDPQNHEDYEPLYLQCMHETGHLFWQMGDKNLGFDFGQWVWEASSLIGETMFKYMYYAEPFWMRLDRYDLTANLGTESVNGVMSDGNKYEGAGRSVVDASATEAFAMLASVLSYDTGYDYFARVNAQRVEEYGRTGVCDVSAAAYRTMLDSAANGRTIDGLSPSEWLFSQPVANTDGELGAYITVIPSQTIIDRGLGETGSIPVETAVFRRIVDGHGDKTEQRMANVDVELRLSDSAGRLLARAGKPSSDEDYETIDLPVPADMSDGVYRVTAGATVDGEALTATTYLVYRREGLSSDKMTIILLNADGTIKTDAGSGLAVTGARGVSTFAVSRGLVVVEADEGANVSVTFGGTTHTLSKPASTRVAVLRLE